MAKIAQLLVISIIGLLGVGALGGSFVVNQYIDDQLEEGIEDALVVKNCSTPGVCSEDDQEDYDDWLTNTDVDDPLTTDEDEADSPLFRRYNFWNLTNPVEFENGSLPVIEEIGPYVYRQYDTKFDVSFNADDTEVSYKKYTFYEFDAARSLKESGAALDPTDVIINVNPAYLGVIEGAGGEMNLRVSFTAQTVATVLEGLQGEFTDGVLAQGPGTALEEIEALATTLFVDSVLVQGSSKVLNQTIYSLISDLLPNLQALEH
ncbi:MAG: hypothetical protein ACXAB7_15190 [Candidatus Kariarchaeaceae archaeon]|jgi:hypothetical protein